MNSKNLWITSGLLLGLLLLGPTAFFSYRQYEFHVKKTKTLERIGREQFINGKIVSMNDDLVAAIEQATLSSLQRPRLWDAELFRSGSADGWNLRLSWISDRPFADGLLINLADGTSEKVPFNSEVTKEILESSDRYFHEATVVAKDSSVLSRSPEDIISIGLLSGNQLISDTSIAQSSWQDPVDVDPQESIPK